MLRSLVGSEMCIRDRVGVRHVQCWSTLVLDQAAALFDIEFLKHWLDRGHAVHALEQATAALHGMAAGTRQPGRVDGADLAAMVPQFWCVDPEDLSQVDPSTRRVKATGKLAVGVPIILGDTSSADHIIAAIRHSLDTMDGLGERVRSFPAIPADEGPEVYATNTNTGERVLAGLDYSGFLHNREVSMPVRIDRVLQAGRNLEAEQRRSGVHQIWTDPSREWYFLPGFLSELQAETERINRLFWDLGKVAEDNGWQIQECGASALIKEHSILKQPTEHEAQVMALLCCELDTARVALNQVQDHTNVSAAVNWHLDHPASGSANRSMKQYENEVWGGLSIKKFSDGQPRWIRACPGCGEREGTKQRESGHFRCRCGEVHSLFRPIHVQGIASEKKAVEIEQLHERWCRLLLNLGFIGCSSSICRFRPEPASVIPQGGPLRELSDLTAMCCNPDGTLTKPQLVHTCELCTRKFGTDCVQAECHDVAERLVRSPDWSAPERQGLAGHSKMDHKGFYAMQREYEQLYQDVVARNKSEEELQDVPAPEELEQPARGDRSELADCYNRLLQVPEVVGLMDEFGVEQPEDLRELDEDDLAHLVAPLKKVPRNKLLRVLGVSSGQRSHSANQQ
eukprot:TRINITY_DN2286_c0_g1_i2.p1 TRINITY_DN2286_c0_g1~~TRINITY_DN2286_c0_g1_i2.p1  ORF type:complete len:625 (+),score=91.39 TRINITY_DN2286_c0_g1_i2:130-2004(+)